MAHRLKIKKAKALGGKAEAGNMLLMSSCISSFEASQYSGSENMENPEAVEAGRNLCSSLIT